MTVCDPEIISILSTEIGLDPATLGTEVLARAVASRMRAIDLADERDYVKKVLLDKSELRELIELIVVPETWFFRDSNPFDLLKKHALDHMARFGPPYRVLSAPCATGEEPYSIVIALMETGIRPGQFTVDAVDISAKALEKAKNGIYTPYSFRSDPVSKKYFTQIESGFKILDNIKSQVRFEKTNLLKDQKIGSAARYDAVFCRNFLIYMHQRARAKVVDKLDRILSKNGLLFVGHAELLSLLKTRFRSVNHSRSFALSKGDGGFDQKPGNRLKKFAKTPARPFKALKPVINEKKSEISMPRADEPDASSPEKDLMAAARESADQGRLAEAKAMCLSIMEKNEYDPELYHLMGTIHLAGGETGKAAEYFNKALYLDPEHEQSLAHLLLMAQDKGDTARISVLRNRLDKVKKSART